MKYLKFFSIHHLALLNDWLEESGELLIDIYQPHSGGSGLLYFINSIEELKQLVKAETWDEIDITIFQENQYSLRGVANEEMLEEALCQVKDGDWYSIISLEKNFPNPINILEANDTHSEMRKDFSRFSGLEIGFGQNPFDICDDWFEKNSEKVFKLAVTRIKGFTKSHDFYENYAENPEKYEWLGALWKES